MMQLSDRAYLVVDRLRNRSLQGFLKDMKAANGGRKNNGWLYQLVDLDPQNNSTVSLCHDGVAVGTLDGVLEELTSGIFFAAHDYALTNPSALVLASQTRRKDLMGIELQRVHEEVGKYLVDKLVDDYGHRGGLLCDTELEHVQGGSFLGKASAR
jgi:hypothetical protein